MDKENRLERERESDSDLDISRCCLECASRPRYLATVTDLHRSHFAMPAPGNFAYA